MLLLTDRVRAFAETDVVYFDCAAMGLLPQSAITANAAGLDARARPWTMSADDPERLRCAVASLLGSAPGDVALTPSASYGMMLVEPLIARFDGTTALVLADEHPSHVLPMAAACARRGTRLRHIEREGRESATAALMDAISRDVAAICVPQVHWLDGERIDLAAIAESARSCGAALIVDATQSAGAMPIGLERVDPDLMVMSGYKWLLGPVGLGYAYVAVRHHDLPLVETGWTHYRPDGGRWFTPEGRLTTHVSPHAAARRFDAAGSANPVALAPALASIQFLAEIGPDAVQAELCRRNTMLREDFPELPWCGEARGGTHILALSVTDPERLSVLMEAASLKASLRGLRLRLSGHVWNSERDFDRLYEVLARLG